MKKYLIYLFSVLIAFSIYSCGGAGQTTESVPTQTSSYSLTKNTLVFDATNPTNPIVPFPNDLLLASTTTKGVTAPPRVVYIPTEGVTDPATLAFYTAIDKLQLQGLSPNTSITIPLGTDKIQLNQTQLQNNIKAIDVTKLVGGILLNLSYTPSSAQDYCYLYSQNQDNETLAVACADTIVGYYAKTNPTALATFIQNILPYINASLIVKQNGNVINAYPKQPFNPGDKYAVVVENGIDNLQTSPIAQALMGDEKLSGTLAPLEPLREAYVGLLPLLQGLGIQKSNILEMFTFSVADKTLGLTDYAQIGAAAEGKIAPSDMDITGYSYADLDNMTYAGALSKNEYLQFDGLSDLPLVCQNLYDNATLRAVYQLPEITDNLKTFMLTPNVYALSDIQKILIQYDFPDNQTNYPVVCKTIFDNATLYDNVTTAIYGNTTNPSGIIIFQHGLGRDKSDAKILADDTNLSGYEFFAMDLPWHGDRIPPNPMFSYMADQCKASGSCYLTSNAINDVMNIYQSLLDMHTFLKFVYAGDAQLMASLGYPPLPVYFLSQSMGSITGSMLLNLDNITQSAALAASGLPANNYISKAVFNVGGANYSAILNNATNPEIMGLLCSALSIPKDQCTPDNVAKYKDTVKYNMTVALFQLVLDPVDPAFMARNPSIKSKVLLQSAYNDTLVPNTSNELLAGEYGYTGYTPILCDSSNPLAQAGWYMFKGEAPYDWINHGFLIHTANTLDELDAMYPSAANHMSLECVNNAEELSREQAAGFFTP